ncbi:hypothetical protein BH11PLA2_BH11PLA2_16250 [soil metagenome]
MPATATYTDDARELVGEFVLKAGKSFLTVRVADVFGEPRTIKITHRDVAEFIATQANLGSGVRTLAGLHGEWRPISDLADLALNWFLRVNIEGLRRTARKIGLEPRF